MAKLILNNKTYPATMKVFTDDDNFPEVDVEIDSFADKTDEVVEQLGLDIFEIIKIKKLLHQLEAEKVVIHEK